MKIELTPNEARVIGCLIEKQVTTPDQYPLSLNALVNACNQKSNRDPLLELDERTVQHTLDDLARKHFVVEKSGFGSRVPKYQHRFCNTEYGTLKLDPQELAIVCELLLRGPQTPGELRTRAARMSMFSDVSEVEAALTRLSEREDGPFVIRLARQLGRRDSQYAHLFSGAVAGGAGAQSSDAEYAAQLRGERGAAAAGAGGGVGAGGGAGSGVGAGGGVGGVSDTRGADARNVAATPETVFPAQRQDQRLTRVEEELRALRAELNDLRTRLGG